MGAVFSCEACCGRGKPVDNSLCNEDVVGDNAEPLREQRKIDANQLQLLPKFTRVAIVLGHSGFDSGER